MNPNWENKCTLLEVPWFFFFGGGGGDFSDSGT